MIPLGPFFSIDAVQENKQHGSCYSAPIRSYQTPVTPVRGHGHQRGGAILSHLSKMAVNKQTWEMLHPRHVSGLRKH